MQGRTDAEAQAILSGLRVNGAAAAYVFPHRFTLHRAGCGKHSAAISKVVVCMVFHVVQCRPVFAASFTRSPVMEKLKALMAMNIGPVRCSDPITRRKLPTYPAILGGGCSVRGSSGATGRCHARSPARSGRLQSPPGVAPQDHARLRMAQSNVCTQSEMQSCPL